MFKVGDIVKIEPKKTLVLDRSCLHETGEVIKVHPDHDSYFIMVQNTMGWHNCLWFEGTDLEKYEKEDKKYDEI